MTSFYKSKLSECLHYFLVSRLLNAQQEHVEQIDDNALGRERAGDTRDSRKEVAVLLSRRHAIVVAPSRTKVQQSSARTLSRGSLPRLNLERFLVENFERTSAHAGDVIFTRE